MEFVTSTVTSTINEKDREIDELRRRLKEEKEQMEIYQDTMKYMQLALDNSQSMNDKLKEEVRSDACSRCDSAAAFFLTPLVAD